MTKKKKKKSWKEKRQQSAIKRQKALESERLRREREPKKSKGWSKGKIFGVAFMFLLIIGIYGAWQYTESSKDNSARVRKAPLFTLTDIEGNVVALENLAGKVVVLDFFFPQCQYCDDEVIHLEEVYREYDRDEVEIISISVKENTIQDLQEFRTGPNSFSNLEYEISWIIARDTVAEDVIGKYDISGYPTTVIIDQEGFLSPNSPFVALTDASTLSREINHLLAH